MPFLAVNIPPGSVGLRCTRGENGCCQILQLSNKAPRLLQQGDILISINGVSLNFTNLGATLQQSQHENHRRLVVWRPSIAVSATSVAVPQQPAVGDQEDSNDNDEDCMDDSIPAVLRTDLLFKQSYDAAQRHINTCICAVLREVALQVLQVHIQRRNSDISENENHDTLLTITEEAITSARNICQALSKQWSSKLQARGRYRLAQQIEDVVSSNGPTLYYTELESISQEIIEAANCYLDAGRFQDFFTSWGRTRDLIRPVRSKEEVFGQEFDTQQRDESMKKAIGWLDEWGEKRQTDWLYSWDVVQDVAREIPTRLCRSYNKESSDDTLTREYIDEQSCNLFTYETKTKVVTLDGDNNVGDDEDGMDGEGYTLDKDISSPRREVIDVRKMVQSILTKKRKNRRVLAHHFKRQRKVDDIPTTEPTPRAPSTIPTAQQIPSHTEWTDVERQRLDAYLHDNEVNEQPRLLLLGSLSDLGQFHRYLQAPIDPTKRMSAPQLHRWTRRCWRERLGDHQEVEEPIGGGGGSKKPPSSRVAACLSPSTNQFWHDFDLRNCLLEYSYDLVSDAEYPPPNVESRDNIYLLAFSNIEALLLNEDPTWPVSQV